MFSVETSLNGVRAVFKDHEEYALKVLADAGNVFIGSREVMEKANAILAAKKSKTRSRATYINFLKHMHEAHLLEIKDQTGKGGHRDEYRLPPGGLNFVYATAASRIIRKLIEAFPDVDFVEVINGLEIQH